MCFYDERDYEWTAMVQIQTDRLAARPVDCDECFELIPLGAPVRELYQQEHESCQICEDVDSESYIGTDDKADFEPEEWAKRQSIRANHNCRYGETYLYRRCQACSNLIKAIEFQEEIEGCPPRNRIPPLTELNLVFTEHESNWEYADRAVEMYPELWGHPFISDLLEA